ncbi:MAG: OHCU decarboxylase [Kordiimonadales bacterium]|nr:MAG: OHCU decarboxylase [Kordiimonadales bacterium]
MNNALLDIQASKVSELVFLEAYGGIYEFSAWAATGAWGHRNGTNLDTVDGLHSAMTLTVAGAEEAAQMKLICAHPDLAQKLAVGEELTEASTNEQTSAGLHKCTQAEYEEFQTLNTGYKGKFGFPFIIAVKGLNRQDILSAFRARINNDRETEFGAALKEIDRIAYFRLCDLTEI